MTIPAIEELITERLALCYAEIDGVIFTSELPPAREIAQAELPAAYTLIGQMLNQIPNTSAGQAIVGRRYIGRLLIQPVANVEDGGPGVGATAIVTARTMIRRYRQYFVGDHPRLSTTTLPDVTLTQDVLLRDTGPVVRQGPGGALYVAVDFEMDIYKRGIVSRTS